MDPKFLFHCLVLLSCACALQLRQCCSGNRRLLKSSKAYRKKHCMKMKPNRCRMWQKTEKKIYRHNLLYKMGVYSYTEGTNSFADLTTREYKHRKLGLKVPKKNARCRSPCIKARRTMASANSVVRLPSTVDWRSRGYVTPVKDQKYCSACWAFVITGALEGQHYRKTGRLVALSEQNLVDCTRPYGNRGCNGGWMSAAYWYACTRGVDRPYPYEARSRRCRYDARMVGARCLGYQLVGQSESALLRAVATVGPIAVAVDASQPSFRYYKAGVLSDSSCSNTAFNHAMLVVGYGTYRGTKYWLLKNSWGTSWGLNGYVMLARDKGNLCGIASYASYPIV